MTRRSYDEIVKLPKEATRKAFGRALADLGAEHPEIVALDADLAKSTQSAIFAKRFPERFFEMGIAEANMLGVAAGLALTGHVPFACSFGCFITGRYDTIRISIGYSNARVRIVGTHAGVSIGEDGHSQMGLEDVALMRAIPNMAVFQPADDVETAAILRYLVEEHPGPAYLRLTRQGVRRIHDPAGYRFQPGELDLLRVGTGPAVVVSGGPVGDALAAAAKLGEGGLDLAVYNAPSLKPLRPGAVAEVARRHGRIITVEDHTVDGGLGSIVAELCAEEHPAWVHRIGVHGFGQSGTPADLKEHYGLSEARLAEAFTRLAG